MKQIKRIYLVGLPGCGKSTFGKALAAVLNLQFVDQDTSIVERTGKSIAEIFDTQGEEAFRKMERNQLRQITTAQDSFLLAAGGGTPCFFENMDFMKSNGIVIFLNTDVDEIAKRLAAQKAARPLMKQIEDTDMKQNLNNILAERLPFYSRAHLVLANDEMDVETAVQKLNALFIMNH